MATLPRHLLAFEDGSLTVLGYVQTMMVVISTPGDTPPTGHRHLRWLGLALNERGERGEAAFTLAMACIRVTMGEDRVPSALNALSFVFSQEEIAEVPHVGW